MAETRSPSKVPAGDTQLVRYLMKAADGDTAYRDVYLQRAVEKLERSISRADYEQLKTHGATVEQLLQETPSSGVTAELETRAGPVNASLCAA